MRLAPITMTTPTLLDFSTSSDVKELQPGTVVACTGTDFNSTANVTNWGACELLYVSNISTAILPGQLCVLYDVDYHITPHTGTAANQNSGKSMCVALTNFGVGSTTEQYGWVIRAGFTPVAYAVAATAGAVYVSNTAGSVTPTAAAGLQVLGMRCFVAGATAFTRLGSTKTGSSIVKFSNVSGMFVGQAISGTGIPASSVISALGTDGTSVFIGSAVGTLVTATATASVTCTMTNTGFGICSLVYPTMQTQIT